MAAPRLFSLGLPVRPRPQWGVFLSCLVKCMCGLGVFRVVWLWGAVEMDLVFSSVCLFRRE